MSYDLNGTAAMSLIIQYISIKDLLSAAMHGFALDDTTKSQENADICSKAIETFLKK